MKEVQQVTLIQTSIATRGDGESTPIRRITQWWTQTGDLVAENDPCSVVVTEEQRRELTSIIGSLGLSAEEFGNAIERVASVLSRQNAELCRPAGGEEKTMKTPIWYAIVQRVGRMTGKDVAEAIAASHPTEMEMPEVYGADELAMDLIHERHSKREIVNLLRWALMGCPSHTVSDQGPRSTKL